MSNRIPLNELEDYLWEAAVYLRSHIDAGSYKQYIFPLLFYKRLCDVYDEETNKAVEENGPEAANFEEIHQFDIPKSAHWNVIRNTSTDVGLALSKAFKKIESANKEKLAGIFGDASWTNKNRLPDSLLKDLIEHFSSKTLSNENCPADELGTGYEYLVGKFADDSGHTAQEFYTNRTVVELMTELLKPQSGESIYDPTCGTGGMLISCVAYLKQEHKEWRNISLYGQEVVTLTSSIARMNMILHGIQDFNIVNADTLKNPAFIKEDKLETFNIVLANPPYSIKKWDRSSFETDKYGRNFLGVPPQGRADYAFFQHILKSMDPINGRCAILFPHGVLSRNEEYEMRKNLVKLDLVECVIGIAKGLFYNSPMEACVIICKTNKPRNRKNKILFIDAKNEVTRKDAFSKLEDEHIDHIVKTYEKFVNENNYSFVADTETIQNNDYSLSIPRYVTNKDKNNTYSNVLEDVYDEWLEKTYELKQEYMNLKQYFNEGTENE